MDGRLFWWFCGMAVLGSVTAQAPKPEISIEKSNMTLVCKNGEFDYQPKPLENEGASGIFSCCSKPDENDDSGHIVCSKARVKILSTENLIQLDMSALITVLVSDVLVTVLIGWAIYIICGQPSTRTSYQDNKASDRKNLIPNERVSNNASGDTYQRLNTRSDEYSTLHGRKAKNPKYPISP